MGESKHRGREQCGRRTGSTRAGSGGGGTTAGTESASVGDRRRGNVTGGACRRRKDRRDRCRGRWTRW